MVLTISSNSVEWIHQQPTYDFITGSLGLMYPFKQMCHSPMFPNGLKTRVHDLYQYGEAKATNIKHAARVAQTTDIRYKTTVAILQGSRCYFVGPVGSAVPLWIVQLKVFWLMHFQVTGKNKSLVILPQLHITYAPILYIYTKSIRKCALYVAYIYVNILLSPKMCHLDSRSPRWETASFSSYFRVSWFASIVF